MATNSIASLILFAFSSLLILQTPLISAKQQANGSFVKSAYWSSDSGLALSSINSTLFTHLFCAFADLNATTNKVTISPSNQALFANFTPVLQRKNPSLKTLLSIGGGNANKTTFAAMARHPKTRKSFIDSSIKVARHYGFYGLDLDWEYPEVAQDMHNLGLLLVEWRASVDTESRTSRNAPLILTIAGYYANDIIYYKYDPPRSVKYPIHAMARSLDWVNAMAYDFYQPTWRNFTEAQAALLDPSGRNFSGSYGTKEWINAGLPAHKLVLGVPFFGYAWRLVNPSNHGLLAPASGPAVTQDGTMFYYQIREFIAKNKDVKKVYNASEGVNYCYKGTTWIGYDGVETIRAKVSYVKHKGMHGYVAWQLSGDDTNFTLSNAAATASIR